MKQDEPAELKSKRKQFIKWDVSIIIALLAVLISTISTFISIKESQIMLKQQEISLEKQAASVWPYLENLPYNNYDGSTIAIFQFVVENKGVGPAIIDSVKYEVYDEEIRNWNLSEVLSIKYPNLKISHLQNARLSGRVMSPGEKHSVIKIRIEKEKNDSTDLSEILDNLD